MTAFLKKIFTSLDVTFYPANYINAFLWVGMAGSFVRYDQILGKWDFFQMDTEVWGYSNASATSLLMGKKHDLGAELGTVTFNSVMELKC